MGEQGTCTLHAEEQPSAIQHLLCTASGQTAAVAKTPADFAFDQHNIGTVRRRTSFTTLGTVLRVDRDLSFV